MKANFLPQNYKNKRGGLNKVQGGKSHVINGQIKEYCVLVVRTNMGMSEKA